MKWPCEMLQNLPYFWNTKTHIVFFRFSFRATYFILSLMNAQVYVGTTNKVAQNEKWKKQIWVFVYMPIYKIYQILKRFAGTFRWAQTSYFWRVCFLPIRASNMPTSLNTFLKIPSNLTIAIRLLTAIIEHSRLLFVLRIKEMAII